MKLNISKARVEIPGVVRYEKAIVLFSGNDDNTDATIFVKNRREEHVTTITAPAWARAGKGWDLTNGAGELVARLESMTGCGCGGMSTTDLTSDAVPA